MTRMTTDGAVLIATTILFAGAFSAHGSAPDRALLTALRNADDVSRLIGPAWLQGVALDATALGSSLVLNVVIVTAAGVFLLAGRYRLAGFAAFASWGGMLLSPLVKNLLQWARPDLVPHLAEVSSWSFPSGHALNAAVVYLVLARAAAAAGTPPAVRRWLLVAAVFGAFLAGASRVVLGVHYPSDVVAGWSLGVAWVVATSARVLGREPG